MVDGSGTNCGQGPFSDGVGTSREFHTGYANGSAGKTSGRFTGPGTGKGDGPGARAGGRTVGGFGGGCSYGCQAAGARSVWVIRSVGVLVRTR